jgi:biotin carboxyl carrier protein
MSDRDESAHSLLDTELLRRLLRRLESTDVDELDLVTETSRLYVRRDMNRRSAGSATPPEQSHRGRGVPVLAPLTGVFYGRSEPTSPPLAALGDRVEAGQVVALIETMKLFNEVSAEVGGEVVAVVAHDGELVEVGQAIMFIEPGERDELGPPLGLL